MITLGTTESRATITTSAIFVQNGLTVSGVGFQIPRSQSPDGQAGFPLLLRLSDQLHLVREFALFLKARHGYAQPADESDEWTRQDELDFTRDSMRHLEEIDPWPDEGSGPAEGKDVQAR